MSSTTTPSIELGTVVSQRFRIEKKIGAGSFGEIYVAYDLNRHQHVAVKTEPRASKHPQIHYEAKIYKLLAGGRGIPTLHWHGIEGQWNVLVLDLLGPSLEEVFTYYRRRLSLKTVLLLAEQMIDRMEYMHKKNYIHRDIKPDNFVYHNDLIYLIDFGLAKKYRCPKTHEHIPMKTGKNLTGTARYVSVNTHLGVEPSRRDDLESLCYVWMYFLRGSLPWQGQKGAKKEKYQKIMALKQDISIDDLIGTGAANQAGEKRDFNSTCSTNTSDAENYWLATGMKFSRPLPQEFKYYLQYCRNLRFTDTPDYSYLRRLMKDVFYRENFSYDRLFDWITVPSKFQYAKQAGDSPGKASQQLTPTAAAKRFEADEKERRKERDYSQRLESTGVLYRS
ncbi:unnamed protein product [Amoebophrya sp. A120]|nr:unnamed protein product [Amoebophrya sp. A120]|eukprot:GSA120T00002538001.1